MPAPVLQGTLIPSEGGVQAQAEQALAVGAVINPDYLTRSLSALSSKFGYSGDSVSAERIYEWVLNNIDFTPYPGVMKGGTLTWMEKAGNDFDTCALLMALLSGQGYSNISYKYAPVWIPLESADGRDAVHWLGVDKSQVKYVLSSLGLLATAVGAADRSDAVLVYHAWVEMDIGGKHYVLDPSFKSYRKYDGFNFADVLPSYTPDSILSLAGTTNANGGFSIAPSNRVAVYQKMGEYAVALDNSLRARFPGKSGLEVIGGRELPQKLLGSLPTTLGFETAAAPLSWARGSIPGGYAVQLMVAPVMYLNGSTIPTADGTPFEVPTYQLEGGQLSLTYSRATNGTSFPRHYLSRENDSERRSRSITWAPSNYINTIGGVGKVIIQYQIPDLNSATLQPIYIWRESGPISRDPNNYSNSGVMIAYGFGRSNERLKYHLDRQTCLSGGTNLDNALNVIGLQYQSSRENFASIMAYSMNGWIFTPYFAGLVYKNTTVDYMLSKSVACPRNTLGSTAADSSFTSKLMLANSYFVSACEHLCIEQSVPVAAVSTAKIASGYGNAGITMYNVKSLAEYQTLKSNGSIVGWQNLDAFLVKSFDELNSRMLLPANFMDITSYGDYHGSGYIVTEDRAKTGYPSAVGMLISGGLSGGSPTQRNTNTTYTYEDNVYNRNLAQDKVRKTPPTQPTTTALDPIDACTGYYSTEINGLTLGSGRAPWGLNFTLQYSQGYRAEGYQLWNTNRTFTHNYDITVRYRHPNDIDLNRASISELAPLVLAARVAFDTFDYDGGAQAWMVPAIASCWATDQLLNSRASVRMGTKTLEFVKRADGQFIAPVGIAASLIKNADGTHTYQERKGLQIDFRAPDGLFTKISDPNVSGAAKPSLNATYTKISLTGPAALYQVTDALGRSLTYNYTSGSLKYVQDSTGRKAEMMEYGDSKNGYGVRKYLENNVKYDKYITIHDESWGGFDPRYNVLTDSNKQIVKSYYGILGSVFSQEIWIDGSPKTSYLGVADGVTRVQDAVGAVSWLYFDRRGRKWAERDALGKISYMKYDGYDRVTSVITPEGRTTSYTYDGNHEVTSITNPAGSVADITPESEDSVISSRKVKDFEGNQTEITYNAQHRPEEIRMPGGIVSGIEYDTQGRVKRTHPASYGTGQWVNYSYDEAATYTKRVTAEYPNKTTDIINFNELGDIIQTIDRGGRKATFEYDAQRRLKTTTLWSGTGYNALSPVGGNPPSGSITTSAEYNNIGDLTGVTNALGGYTQFEIDSSGNLLSVTDPDKVTRVDYGYYDNGKLATQLGLFGQKASMSYYDDGQLKSITDALNRKTSFTYTDDGLLQETKSPKQNVTDATYDETSDAETVGDANGNVITPGHDKDSRPTSLKNRRNNTFTTAYDFTSRKVTSTTPLLKTSTTESNTRGLVKKVTTASNRVIENTSFDDEGRVLTQTIKAADDTLLSSVSYHHNDDGSLDTVTEGGKTTKRIYDDFGRLWKYQDGEGNTLEYAYDKAGKLAQLKYPDGKTVTYAYDDKTQLLTSVTDWASIPRVTSFTYDLAGRLQTMTRPNQTTRTITYDGANQVRMIEERKADADRTLIWFNALKYDLDGNPNWIMSDADVASWTKPDDSATNDTDNRLLTWNGQSVVHDNEGNMTNGPRPNGSMGSYDYDCYNRLQSAGGVTNRYNPDGLRVEVSGVKYAVDPNSALSRVLVRDAGGTDVTRYVYGPGGILLYQVDASDNCTYYHPDHLGSTVALTDSSANVTGRASYSSYGTVISNSGTLNTPFLYHGTLGCMTDSNGLVFMRARYYNPRIGRFLNADPIGFAGGMNWYAFCGNNPMAKVDPSGLQDAMAGYAGMLGYSSMQEAVIGAQVQQMKSDPAFQMASAIGQVNSMIDGANTLATYAYAVKYSFQGKAGFAVGLKANVYAGPVEAQIGAKVTGYTIAAYTDDTATEFLFGGEASLYLKAGPVFLGGKTNSEFGINANQQVIDRTSRKLGLKFDPYKLDQSSLGASVTLGVVELGLKSDFSKIINPQKRIQLFAPWSPDAGTYNSGRCRK